MARGARVDSIDALKAFRTALFKFADASNVALSDAEGEIHRTLMWLENEQRKYWGDQVRKRTELVSQAQDALRQKKYFKDSSGRTPSAVDEEKALALAMRRLEEAQAKLDACHRYIRRLQKDLGTYKAGVQRFATAVQSDIPVAAAHLDKLVESLEAYVALAPTVPDAAVEVSGTASGGGAVVDETLPSMARPADVVEPPAAELVEPPAAEEPAPTPAKADQQPQT